LGWFTMASCAATTHKTQPGDRTLNQRKRLVWIALLVLVMVFIVVWAIDLAQTAQSLRIHLAQVQALPDISLAVPEKAAMGCNLARGLRQDVLRLRRDTGFLIPLVPAFGWLPKVGGDLQSAPRFLEMGDYLTEAGVLTCGVLEPILATLSAGEGNAVALLRLSRQITEQQATLGNAIHAAQRAQQMSQQIKVETLSPSLALRMAVLQKNLPFLNAGLAALPLLPDLLGVERPRTYLIQALNEDELRPAGGFLTGVGEVRLQGGQIISMTFRDSYAVDDYKDP